jgi:hypothetical protein
LEDRCYRFEHLNAASKVGFNRLDNVNCALNERNHAKGYNLINSLTCNILKLLKNFTSNADSEIQIVRRVAIAKVPLVA